ncbi:bifunctional 4-hydroxy-2-oxoglutarate aldolase/2-dehydro-3-deoxy-phosphogluconate aldolase [Pseudonocardia cypriaca]|uniref:2-dehydro-3-deoxy-phosphogluconate aldolase n=1 Tax=Pseudonocardia cypriaca TaxID=882449 RepID=A0A543FU71_9PSEU|nr:bifunctional 4-hydroxy-2-oxoglutarate aldolase/2-dehydro-3-deoxy-phosphogluconate aldolase [Pseudonocardia cypriaca]TQM37353.1 2-keto-3-deoxy-phosphogluconate aldolase [Pseudonocardia cypriaca]
MAPESDVLTAVEALAVVPVVEIDDAATAVPLARTLAEAGLPVVEVTFRTPAARDAVAAIAAELPDFLLGAGTLVLPDMVASAAEAGARFGVSPGYSRTCLDAAEKAGLPFVPGAVTPSEVGACLEAGARHIKFFPAGAYGGISTLKALDGPFGWTGARFMPTGGVRPENVAEYLALPNVFAVGGTWIAPRSDITEGRWDAIAERARAAAALRTQRVTP